MNDSYLNTFSQPAMFLLLDSAVRATIVILAVGGAARFTRRSGAASRHRLWLAGIIAAALMPLMMLTPGWRVLPAATQSISTEVAHAAAAETSEPNVPVDVMTSASTSVPHFHSPETFSSPPVRIDAVSLLIKLAAIAWATGLIAMLGRLVISRLKLRQLSRCATPASDELQDSLRTLLCDQSVRRAIRLLQSPDNSLMPMTWGFFQPTILLPAAAHDWSIARRRMVLLHELSHVRRFDYAWIFLAEVVSAIYWFNPLSRWAINHLRDEAEQACDERVLRAGEDRCSYADELLATVIGRTRASRPTALALGMSRCSTLEGRLKLILKPTSSESGRRVFLVAFLLIAMLAPLSQIRLAAQTNPAPRPAISEKPTSNPTTAPAGQEISYGGTLRDTEGKPISGATLRTAWQVPHRLGEFEKIALSDAAGNWDVSVDPTWTIRDIRAADPGYVRLLIQRPDADLLKAHKFAVTFEHPVTLTGYVRDEKGNPIAGALIEPPLVWSHLTRVNGQRKVDPAPIYTGADGKFVVEGLSRSNMRLYISANTFAPAIVYPKDPAHPVVEMLSTGGEVAGVVKGLDGKPMPNAKVTLTQWQFNGLHHFSREATSDENGRFTLLHVPEQGTMLLQASRPSGNSVAMRVTAREGAPYELQIVHPAAAHLTIVDDVTGKPVTAFSFSVSDPVPNSDEIRFFSSFVNVDSGNGTWVVESKSRNIYSADQPFRVRVYADNYMPEDSPIFRVNSEGYFTLRMKKAKMFSGHVVNPDGSPAARAQVMWVRPQQHAFVANNGKLDESMAMLPDSIVTTDADGRFESLKATSTAGNIVAICPTGYVVVSGDAFGKDTKLTLLPWASVSGKILRGDKPMVNQRVTLAEHSPEAVVWASRDTLVNADGAYGMRYLPAGSANILLEFDGKGHTADLEIQSGHAVRHDYFEAQ